MLPGLVGFAPRNSIVLIAFRGRRTCGAMRVDLPVSDDATVQKRIATHLIGMICKLPSADAIIPVVVTDDRFDGGEAIPHAGLLAILALLVGVPVLIMVLVEEQWIAALVWIVLYLAIATGLALYGRSKLKIEAPQLTLTALKETRTWALRQIKSPGR